MPSSGPTLPGHHGHAHDIAAHGRICPYLRRRLEPGALGADVRAFLVYFDAGRFGRQDTFSKVGTERLGHVRVDDDVLIVERRRSALRKVDELVYEHEIPGPDEGTEAPRAGDGDDLLDPACFNAMTFAR